MGVKNDRVGLSSTSNCSRPVGLCTQIPPPLSPARFPVIVVPPRIFTVPSVLKIPPPETIAELFRTWEGGTQSRHGWFQKTRMDAAHTWPRKAVRGGISKSILDRFVNFWQQFPTKWLQNRPQIPKPSPGIPPHRAFCGQRCQRCLQPLNLVQCSGLRVQGLGLRV